MLTKIAPLSLFALVVASPACAEKIVELVQPEAVAAAFLQNRLTEIHDGTADPQFPTITATRSDGFTISATFYACSADGCSGLTLAVPMAARELRYATIIEGSIQDSPLGFDAWVQKTPPVVIIETYLVFDGGVSEDLVPSTVMSLMNIVDQTKDFMLSDDPNVAEVWPDQSKTR